MAAPDHTWKTAITRVQPNDIRLRGYRIDELMGRVSFAQAIYLTLTGALPSLAVSRLIDAMLVASIDHGVTPPSALAARTAASTGAPLNAAIAAGVLSINRHHGGAVEGCMRLIEQVVAAAGEGTRSLTQASADLVTGYRAAGERLPGFGHRIHTADPRTARLFALAEEAGVAGDGVAVIHALEQAIAQATGRALPVNVDGAIAALLVDLDVPPELGNAFFIMARVPGLIAHVYEEWTRERPLRRIDPVNHEYDGPEPAQLGPEESEP
ncbi:MAG: citryl-CoA lyase [Anaerolineae bacterium]|nr:citryl-CoA lyase [Anaerolineae bacterium]